MPKSKVNSRPTNRKNRSGDVFSNIDKKIKRQDRAMGLSLGKMGMEAPGLKKRERIVRKKK